MNTKVLLGSVSELLTIVGTLCFAGLPEGSWGSITGAILAALAVALAVYRHSGVQMVFTLARKFLSSLPAIGLSFGWLDASTAAQLVSAVGPLSALAWSYLVNAGLAKGPLPPKSDGRFPVILIPFLIGVLTLSLSSCAVQIGPDGKPLLIADSNQFFGAIDWVSQKLKQKTKEKIDENPVIVDQEIKVIPQK